MNTLQISLISLLVVAFVIYRQLRTRPAAGTATLYVAGAMVIVGLVTGGLFDTAHLALSLALFLVEAGAAVALGVWRARTVRVWLDSSGVAWSKATRWTILAWLASAATRAGLYFAGTAIGLTASTSSVLLFLGLTVGIQAYLVARRGRALSSTGARPDTFVG
ncbi:hypothetical protein HCN51_10625 [Nonomuraea sp. FMUSA5-5]|uniref:DUF1453 domain-containing protein n=1 Tax=Nonomuraea composti TaxID=2720023 RepID=A0ABX1B0Q7_9ACTN|nr:hypothetical protein [Nonomuraea sp. FMUSA5-5]NJP89894.1 hypothetical protein [Nonomuraea sp. FMUSA5-5]